jgi:hypothetical protein
MVAAEKDFAGTDVGYTHTTTDQRCDAGQHYALIALGYTMVYGILRIINFAHGDILMVGALTTFPPLTP